MKTLPLNLRDWLQLWIDGSNNWSTTYYDVSGNARNGTSAGTVTNSRILQHKNVFHNLAQIETPANILWNWDNTISCWFKVTTRPLNNYKYVMYSWWPNSYYPAQFIDWTNDNGTIRVRNICNNTGNTWFSVAYNWAYAELELVWVHVVATKTSNVLKLYINWIKRGTDATVTWTANWDTYKTMIWAAYWDWWASKIAWYITNTMLWNRALTDTEIQQLHKSQYIK